MPAGLGDAFLLGLAPVPPIPSRGPCPPLLEARYLLQREIWHGVLVALFYGPPAESDIDGAGVDKPGDPPADAHCRDRRTKSHMRVRNHMRMRHREQGVGWGGACRDLLWQIRCSAPRFQRASGPLGPSHSAPLLGERGPPSLNLGCGSCPCPVGAWTPGYSLLLLRVPVVPEPLCQGQVRRKSHSVGTQKKKSTV